ncbi:hypothetical protein niasHS_017512 [Heterodera schachtii]|uniref:Uncharacterized protein n=1 Tax=Heterodera schachtii TaxID=97005 RepID=A0ABD2I0S7_HETSC
MFCVKELFVLAIRPFEFRFFPFPWPLPMASHLSITVPTSIIALFVLLLALHGTAPNQLKIGENGLFEENLRFSMLRQLDKRSPLKKSDGLSDFVGSLNGAARLRYGKRSDGLTAKEIEQILSLNRWKMPKRVANYAEALPVGLLDQLNGAERLRFGRK